LKALRDLYKLLSIAKIENCRRLGWVGYVARKGRQGIGTGFWWEILVENGHL
jgi:hypothetical protein